MKLEDIKTPEELIGFRAKTVKYGFVSEDGKIYEPSPTFGSDMDKHYKIRLGEDLIRAGYGVCWDFTEFERLFFENRGIEHECYYIKRYLANGGTSTHAFLIYKDGDKWRWLEDLSKAYDTSTQALEGIMPVLLNKHEGTIQNKFDLHKYPKVEENLTSAEFMEHCESEEQMGKSQPVVRIKGNQNEQQN